MHSVAVAALLVMCSPFLLSGQQLNCNNEANGSRFPKPTDCSRYIWCVNGRALDLPCGPGTYFSLGTRFCSSTNPRACEGSPLDGFCNGKAADQGYADPAGDCTKFILCDRSNRATRMTCGDNNQAPYGLLFYSVSDQRCERPAFSGCTPGQRQ